MKLPQLYKENAMKQIYLEKIKMLNIRSNEAYKALRTNIQFCGSDIRMICLTSCLPNEGKSSVSFNLAKSFAESGKRTVYVDADLRRSSTIGRYKPDQGVLGLTHYLSGQNMLADILYASNIPDMDIIFTGPIPPNPTELLESGYFNAMLKMLKEEYEYVIIDTPPLGSVIDSAIVAQKCDGVVLVIETGAVGCRLALKVKEQLEKGNCRMLGAVLNKVRAKKGQYYYYGRRYKKYSKAYNYA